MSRANLLLAQTTVKLERTNDSYRLLRNNEPYAVKGVGGTTQLDLLAAAGGNSIRTWSTDQLDTLLDEAHKRKLTVCVGMWLGHERHGFNYQNEASVLDQLETCLKAVRKYQDHPAVLMWGIGNEMEGSGTNPAVWYAVDHIAREIKKIDPNHPTMTVIAELGANGDKVRALHRYCPNIDIVGLNSYAGIGSLAERYRKAGGTKPYIVTEHGPAGPWETGKAAWGSSIEATSTAKGEMYANGYKKAVTDQPGLALGSYAFLWGQKQETTATWFGMLLPDGTRLAAVDAMSAAWRGTPPKNLCPKIESLTLDRGDGLKPGETIRAKLSASDPEGAKLTVKWVLRYDSGTIGVGGDAEAEERTFADTVKGADDSASLTIPESGGAYRLFAYVYDDQKGAAVANVPLRIDAPIKAIPSPQAKLPFLVYGDEQKESPYIPAGYMGKTEAIAMTLDCEEKPQAGKTCLKVEYKLGDQWGGVLWQSPPGDWEGNKPGGLNLTGAKSLEFWVRGAAGGETVNFMFGTLEGAKPYRDSAKGELKDVRLTAEWQKLRIPLEGRDLSRIKTGFGWSLAGQGKPVTFYLDEIRFSAE